MKSQVEIKNYGPKLEKKHFDFATKMYGGRRKRRNSDYLYWKFRGKPDTEMHSLKLALIDGVVVGQLGLIPCKVNIGNEIIDTQWACDLIVDLDYRGKGIAKLLYDAAHAQKAITLGSDPSPSAEISMLRAGYKKLNSSNKQFIPIYLGLPLRMKGIKVKLLDKLRNPFLKTYSKSKHKKNFKEIDIININHKQAFQLDSANQVFIERDESFKNWRLTSFKNYYPGVKMYNLEGTKTYYSGYYLGDIYFITDFYLEKESHFQSIIRHILNYIPKNIERIRFQNNTSDKLLGSKLTTIKYSTYTSIIYYTKDLEIENKIQNKYFYYTHQDTDENI